MAPPVRGFGGTLGLGVENPWGTAVPRTNWKPMTTMGIRRMPTREVEPELGRFGEVSTMSRHPYQVNDFAGGPITFPACYNDSTIMLLGHLLGAVATTDLGGPGPYEHNVTLASPVPIGLTLECINGTGNGVLTGMTEVFEGCKLNGGKISLTAGGLMMIETEVIAQTSGGLVAAGTPDYNSSFEYIKHNHTPGVLIGGSPRAVNSLVITITRGLNRNHELGSLFTSEPWEAGLEVEIELRTKWQTNAFDTAVLAGTQADLTMAFTGTGVNSLDLTAHNAQIWEVTRDVDSKGAIEQIIKARAFGGGGDQGLSLLFTNANSGANDN